MKYVETGARQNGKTTRAWVLLRNAIANYKRVVVVGYTGQMAEFYLARLRQNEVKLDGVHFISCKSTTGTFEEKLQQLGISQSERSKTLFLFDEVIVNAESEPVEEAYVAKVLAAWNIQHYIFVSYDNKKKWDFYIDKNDNLIVHQPDVPTVRVFDTEAEAHRAGIAELTRQLLAAKEKFERLSKSAEKEIQRVLSFG